jgi:prepilin-type N-terminal cleavage/methylation domain-containing protein
LVDRRRDHSGFTLIEVLIASAIIAMIMAMVYGSYAATTRSLQRCESQTTCRKRTDMVVRLMTRQIASAFAPISEPNDKPGSVPEAVFRGNGENPQGEFLTFLTTLGSSIGANTTQTLVSTTYQYDAANGSLAIRQAPRMGRSTGSDNPGWITILTGVTDLKVEFHDGLQWKTRWDNRESQISKLPRAVRISLAVSDVRGGSCEIRTVMPILCRSLGRIDRS